MLRDGDEGVFVCGELDAGRGLAADDDLSFTFFSELSENIARFDG